MGEIRATVELFNAFEREMARKGLPLASPAAEVTLDMFVDTGAVLLLLPQEVVEKLRLSEGEKRVLVLTSDRKVELRSFYGLGLKVLGRTGYFDCLEGPPNCEGLVGQVVMESLDLIPDPANRRLQVRPESPFVPLVKMK